MTEILTADNLATISSVRHGFFTRSYGNGGYYLQENPQDVFTARARMSSYLQVTSTHLLTGYQHHSADVVTVTQIWDADHRPRTDALVTNKIGFALGVLTADCVPILFADAEAGVIGVAHAGWRGAVSGVIDNTVAAMEKLGARRSFLHSALGPCIWQKSYEVGSEFPAFFLAENPAHKIFFQPAPRKDHFLFDLPGYVVARLQGLGIKSISSSPADTCAEPNRFYSHRYSTLRGEKREGNLMSAIALL